MPRRVTSSARRHKVRTPKDEAESPRSSRPIERRESEETEEFREQQIQSGPGGPGDDFRSRRMATEKTLK